MAETTSASPGTLSLVPKNPLPLMTRVSAARNYHHGPEILRDAGGPVTRSKLGPTWLIPTMVVVTSPQGAHDVLSRKDEYSDKKLPMLKEHQALLGANLFNLCHDDWLPRRRVVQPVLTKQHVAQFAGHMVDAAKQFPIDSSPAEVDLDAECRAITLRALGRSVLGVDLHERSNRRTEPLRTALQYLTDRSLRPVRAPRSWPTPARHRAQTAIKEMRQLAGEIVQICRADPSHDAPLVQALLAATDPTTGMALSDTGLRDELVSFMFAGQDTTSTALAYSLWELGNHGDMQDRVAQEVGTIGDRPLTAADIPHLTYTAHVLHEALRLCPPAPVVARCAMTDVDVDGYRVEAGTMMIVGIYALHRDPSLWNDPLRFDPDRFDKENSKGRHRWQYLPFGGGARSCVGDHFAMLEAVLALATIVRSTRIRSIDTDFPLALPFTMVAGAPIRAEVRPRSRY